MIHVQREAPVRDAYATDAVNILTLFPGLRELKGQVDDLSFLRRRLSFNVVDLWR